MAFFDHLVVKDQHFADEATLLVLVVDDERADAEVDTENLKVQIGDLPKSFPPVCAEGVFSPDHAIAADEQLPGEGRGAR